jgi:hypothetical protein
MGALLYVVKGMGEGISWENPGGTPLKAIAINHRSAMRKRIQGANMTTD